MALTRPVLMMSSSARTIPVHSTGSVSTPCHTSHKAKTRHTLTSHTQTRHVCIYPDSSRWQPRGYNATTHQIQMVRLMVPQHTDIHTVLNNATSSP